MLGGLVIGVAQVGLTFGEAAETYTLLSVGEYKPNFATSRLLRQIPRGLEQSLALPEPSEDACRRHYAAHAARYRTGERVRGPADVALRTFAAVEEAGAGGQRLVLAVRHRRQG